MADSSILLKQFDGSNYSQYFPQNLPLDIANQFVNSEGKNSNDIFNYLRKYCQYWWRKYFDEQVTEYLEVKADITKTVEIYKESRYRYNYEETPPASFSFQFSPSIIINSEGIKLKEAQNYTITFITYNYLSEWENDCIAKINSFLKENAPCYCNFSGVIYYLPQDTTVKNHNEDATIRIYDYTGDDDNDYHIIQLSYISSTRPNIKAQNVTATSKTYQKTETQYVNSINKLAYPDGEKIDNWLYTYLGIPFENSVDPLKCPLKFQQLMSFETDMAGYSQKTIYSPVIDITNGVVGLQFNFIFSDDIQTKTYSSGTGLQILLNSTQLLNRKVSSAIGQKVFKKGERINFLSFFTYLNHNNTSQFLSTTFPSSEFYLNSNFQLERIPIKFYSGDASIVFSSRKIITNIYAITVS